MKLSIEERFKAGIQLRDKGSFTEAINEFLEIISEFPLHPQISKIYTILAGVYRDTRDISNSLKYFKKATELNPKSELASLGLYVSYIKMNEHESAIGELNRYLSENKAEMYKDTLDELLTDVSGGYLPKYKNLILELAGKNNIPFG